MSMMEKTITNYAKYLGGKTRVDHEKILTEWSSYLEHIPADTVILPTGSVNTYLEEAFAILVATREHMEELEQVGLLRKRVDDLESLVKGLASAQALWHEERKGDRDDRDTGMIETAEHLRDYMIDAATLAMRNNNEGQRRLMIIRENDSITDLVSDLTHLSSLMLDAPGHFQRLNVNVSDVTGRADRLAEAIRDDMKQQDMTRPLHPAKENRDRMYTLVHEGIQDICAHAQFAYRDDMTNHRRGMFTTIYERHLDRRYANTRHAGNMTPSHQDIYNVQ